MRTTGLRQGRRSRVAVVIASVIALLVALAAGDGTVGAVTPVPSGYRVFGALPFGDAGSCGLLGYGGPANANAPVVGMATTGDCSGSWVAAADGGVFTAGSSGYFGSAAALRLDAPVVGIAATPDGGGYWLVAGDGGVFGFGDARFFGSAAALRLRAPVVGMAATPDGRGYWLVAADGGVFAFGDAGFFGSATGLRLGAPVVRIAVTSDGLGYWLAAADGGVFAFGDAPFAGSVSGIRLAAPVTAIAASHGASGYWLVGADGGVFAFGAARYFGSPAAPIGSPYGSDGSTVIANPVIELVPSPSGDGYLLVPTTPALDPAAGRSGYSLAKYEWEIAELEVAVYQSETWQQAASYLALGAKVDGGETAGYAAAISELEQLAAIPEMDVTPAQSAEASADVAALDAFFHLAAAASA